MSSGVEYNSNFFECLKHLSKSVNHFSMITEPENVAIYAKKLSEAVCFEVKVPKTYFNFESEVERVNIFEYQTFYNLLALVGENPIINIVDPDILVKASKGRAKFEYRMMADDQIEPFTYDSEYEFSDPDTYVEFSSEVYKNLVAITKAVTAEFITFYVSSDGVKCKFYSKRHNNEFEKELDITNVIDEVDPYEITIKTEDFLVIPNWDYTAKFSQDGFLLLSCDFNNDSNVRVKYYLFDQTEV